MIQSLHTLYGETGVAVDFYLSAFPESKLIDCREHRYGWIGKKAKCPWKPGIERAVIEIKGVQIRLGDSPYSKYYFGYLIQMVRYHLFGRYIGYWMYPKPRCGVIPPFLPGLQARPGCQFYVIFDNRNEFDQVFERLSENCKFIEDMSFAGKCILKDKFGIIWDLKGPSAAG